MGGEPQNPRRNSVHQCLGGGAVADILMWRNWPGTVLVLISSTSIWLLFERGGYNFLSFTTNVFLLLVTILFFWAKSAALLNRPLPPFPDLEISDATVEKVAEVLRAGINRVLSVATELADGANLRLFIQVVLGLWVVSYVGSLSDFTSLLYIGVLLSLIIPPLYAKFQRPVDDVLRLLNKIIQVQLRKLEETLQSKIPPPVNKDKMKKIH